MAGRDLKALFRAYRSGDELAFRRAATAIIEEEEAKQHVALARDLRKLMASGEHVTDGSPVFPDPPLDQENDWPLVEVRRPKRYLVDLVTSPRTSEQIQRVLDEIPAWDRLKDTGIPQRRRILFYGPPGCGKSSAAEAMASELDVPLIVVRLDSVISSYLGQTAANLRRIMDYADSVSAVVLFDEFDALGRMRDDPTEHGEIKRVVNAFLQMLDAYRGPSLLVAATNHEGLLDAALWRRFDAVVEFSLPTVHQIRKLLRMRLGSLPHRGLDIDTAASQLKGLPHAAVEATAWSAMRSAIVDGRDRLRGSDLVAAAAETSARPW